jgi:hypothetical protein
VQLQKAKEEVAAEVGELLALNQRREKAAKQKQKATFKNFFDR